MCGKRQADGEMKLWFWGKALIFLCCTGLGICVGNQTFRRMRQLRQGADFLGKLASQLAYSGKAAPALVEELSQEEALKKFSFLQSYRGQDEKNFPQRWKISTEQLTPQDDFLQEQLLLAGQVLGACSLDRQLSELEQLRRRLESQAAELSQKAHQDKKLYPSLGVLAGVFFCILL